MFSRRRTQSAASNRTHSRDSEPSEDLPTQRHAGTWRPRMAPRESPAGSLRRWFSPHRPRRSDPNATYGPRETAVGTEYAATVEEAWTVSVALPRSLGALGGDWVLPNPKALAFFDLCLIQKPSHCVLSGA